MEPIAEKFIQISQQGFTTLKHFIPLESLGAAEELLDAIVEAEKSDSTHIDVNRPTKINSQLIFSDIYIRCQAFAAAYFGKKSYYLYDHAIYKLPSNNNPTEWHQDQAYLTSNNSINSLHFWIPFQDSDVNNGVIRFYNRKTATLLPHEKRISHGAAQMVIRHPPEDHIVAHPLAIGDITVHTNMTVHGATPNRSFATRKAWIIHFGDKHIFFKRMDQVKHTLTSILTQ